jgi:hypothetical protein
MNKINISQEHLPLVAIDKSLDKLREKVSFPKKLETANKMLSKVNLPKNKHRA